MQFLKSSLPSPSRSLSAPMENKLIFSFASGLNFALDQTHLTNTPVIRFGLGFEFFKVTLYTTALTVPTERLFTADHKPLLQFDLRSDIDFAYLKRKAAELPPPQLPIVSASIPARHGLFVSATSAFKELITLENLGAHSAFDTGRSSSRPTPRTRTQRRNYCRRIRRLQERIARETKGASHVVDFSFFNLHSRFPSRTPLFSMEGKLIFSFAYGVDLILDQTSLSKTSVICFNLGFDFFKVSRINTTLFVATGEEVPVDEKPLLQFDLRSGIEFPSLKRKVVEVPTPQVPVVSTAVFAELGSVVAAPPTFEGKTMLEPVGAHSVFENDTSSSSKPTPLTRT